MESKSTETASHSFIQSDQEALDSHLHAEGTFLELSKAYDVINHIQLLDKLDSYGIRGSVNSWFQSYLTKRKQLVVLSASQWTDKQPTGSDCLHSHGSATYLINNYKSSAPEDEHKVARNMLSNL